MSVMISVSVYLAYIKIFLLYFTSRAYVVNLDSFLFRPFALWKATFRYIL